MELTTIFYEIDNFCKSFEKEFGKKILVDREILRERKTILFASEVMTILVYYHCSGYKDFKNYYTRSNDLKAAFKQLPSYNRFIELQKKVLIPLAMFAKLCSSNSCDGVSFIDSFPLSVSHQKRISSHKTFRGLAARGKTSVGWFYGFKVHLVISTKGEIVNFTITSGNIADNNNHVIEGLLGNVWGKIFGDKGYILNPDLWGKLYLDGKQVITKLRNNMKNKLMDMGDKLMLKKRGIIESVGSILKENLNIEHSRYRSPATLFVNVFSALIAYQFRPKKPQLKLHELGSFPLLA